MSDASTDDPARKHRALYQIGERDLPSGVVAEVMFGLYPHKDAPIDGIDTAEMAIRWKDLGQAGIVARLEVFDESWRALAGMTDVIAWLATLSTHRVPTSGRPNDPVRGTASVDEVIAGLVALSFEDRSRRDQPTGAHG